MIWALVTLLCMPGAACQVEDVNIFNEATICYSLQMLPDGWHTEVSYCVEVRP